MTCCIEGQCFQQYHEYNGQSYLSSPSDTVDMFTFVTNIVLIYVGKYADTVRCGCRVEPVNFPKFKTAEDVTNDNCYNVTQERQNLLHESDSHLTDSEGTRDTPVTSMQLRDATTPSTRTQSTDSPSSAQSSSSIGSVASGAAEPQGSTTSPPPSTPVSAPRTHPGIDCDFVSNSENYFVNSGHFLMLNLRLL